MGLFDEKFNFEEYVRNRMIQMELVVGILVLVDGDQF